MKFAKELEDDLVPEWRVKYLNYKVGKKKIKAVARSFRGAHNTPKAGGRQTRPPGTATPFTNPLPYTHYDFSQRGKRPNASDSTQSLVNGDSGSPQQPSRPDPFRTQSVTMFSKSPPVLMPESEPGSPKTPETQPLNIQGRRPNERRGVSYGSIIGTPPTLPSTQEMPSLELPDPAMSPTATNSRQTSQTTDPHAAGPRGPHKSQPPTDSPDAYHIGPDQGKHKFASSLPRHLFKTGRTSSSPSAKNTFPQSKLKRMFSVAGIESPGVKDVQLDAYRDLDTKQDDFFAFLDKELLKIESFYKSKEDEANDRLRILREQLHELRDRRMEDMQALEHGSQPHEEGILDGLLPVTPLPSAPFKEDLTANGHGVGFLQPLQNAVKRKSVIGKTSKAMENLSSPSGPRPKSDHDPGKSDFVRRNHTNEKVPYRYAKRRLKLAMQEFYRSLELLKSYALLNRTGFRKINKKYDKAVNARPTGRYMSEKVNNAHFVQSSVIEGHIVAVEDLYARYFERGNHKLAVSKLRTKLRTGDQSATSFRNGLFVAAGIIFAIEGLIRAYGYLSSDISHIPVQAGYLLQIYAGYFFGLLLFLIFVLCCKVWTAAKINYIFIFEYDTRHVLDWRQLAELPCFFFFLEGLSLWLNFRRDPIDIDVMFLYYPVLMIGITLIIMCLPLRVLHYQSRKWWGFSNWRLLLAGLYPVEFRDFFLGDMYCSQTYAMSQMEVFFCLYATDWRDPTQCNSNHSRLLGFFTTLPAIWRALQCLRRYYDSRSWFPHLANFVKYCFNITYYMTLSMYRINEDSQLRAVFIVVACINAVYCSFWDVAMDFSLGNPYAKHPFLRDRLGYRRVWVYYVAAVLDIVLRQQWIFFAIYTHDLQHSAFLSFAVSLSEVLRRGMWSLFRVENEHCNNVGKFRASREIELPYSMPGSPDKNGDPLTKTKKQDFAEEAPNGDVTTATGADLERAQTGQSSTSSELRQRKTPGPTPGIRALQRVGTVIAAAHAYDFTKKHKHPVDGGQSSDNPSMRQQDSSDEEYDDDDVVMEDEENHRKAMQENAEDEDDIMQVQKAVSRGHG